MKLNTKSTYQICVVDSDVDLCNNNDFLLRYMYYITKLVK